MKPKRLTYMILIYFKIILPYQNYLETHPKITVTINLKTTEIKFMISINDQQEIKEKAET